MASGTGKEYSWKIVRGAFPHRSLELRVTMTLREASLGKQGRS